MQIVISDKAVRYWLADMRSAKLAKNDTECARLLGIGNNTMTQIKRRGADQRTALAMAALLHRLEPYS